MTSLVVRMACAKVGSSISLRGIHSLGTKRGCRIPHQRHVITEFCAVAGRRLDASIREHSYHDDLFDAALLELEVEVGIAKSVMAPMLLDYNIAWLGYELEMPVAAPRALSEDGFALGGELPRAGMTPSIITAVTPLTVRAVKLRRLRDAPRRLDQCGQGVSSSTASATALALGRVRPGPLMAVRPEGANHQWRRVPPG